jgi:two-component system chemotaxis response regulator CheB
LPKRDIIVVGGSAGASAALHRIVRALSPDLTAAVFIVTHVPVHGPMLLAGLLEAQTDLPVAYAREGDEIRPGRILIGPPGHHLMLTSDGVQLGSGPPENLSRPAIDVLFRSAAVAFGGRVVGVVLSGMLNDGAAGAVAIKQCGGALVVQDPLDAASPDMPRAVLKAVDADHIVGIDGMAPLLESLAREEAPLGRAPSAQMLLEVETAVGARLGTDRLLTLAKPSTFSCPDCSGVLSEVQGEGPLRYRCQIGHAVTAEVLHESQEKAMERALSVALRILEERVALVGRLVEDAQVQGNAAAAALHETRAAAYAEQADILRRAVIATVNQRAPTGG